MNDNIPNMYYTDSNTQQ